MLFKVSNFEEKQTYSDETGDKIIKALEEHVTQDVSLLDGTRVTVRVVPRLSICAT